MNAEDAFDLLQREYDADDGLLILFRMSQDVETARLERFIEALNALTIYYEGQSHVEKHAVFMIMSFRQTLSASAGHWKVSLPKGLSAPMTSEIIAALGHVFAS